MRNSRGSGQDRGKGTRGASRNSSPRSGGKGRPAARATARPAPRPKYFEDDPNKNDRPSFHADGRKRRQRNVKEEEAPAPRSRSERPASRERFSESRERSSAPRGRSSESRERSSGPRGRSDESRERSSAPRGRSSESRERSSGPRGRTGESRERASGPRGRSTESRERAPGSRSRFPESRERSSGPRGRSSESRERSFSPRERDDERGGFSRREGGSSPREFGAKKFAKKKFEKKKSPAGRFAPQRSKFAEPKEDDGRVRLNKFIANCGICSRREADELISAGVITVNGEVVTELGTKVGLTDTIKYNNQVLRGERPVYLLLNKPKDYITTVDDPGKRHTVMELIANACKERVYPVGRLDRNTTGVLLFTNDGELARRLMHPSFEVQKVYQVELDKNLSPEDFEKISKGLTLEDGPIKVDDIAYTGEGRDRKVIGVELHSGRNRIVRRIFEHLHYEVQKLDRTVFAGLTKKDLPRGRWRFLTPLEVANLHMQVGRKYAED